MTTYASEKRLSPRKTSIQLRKHPIQDHDIGIDSPGDLERGVTVEGFVNLETPSLEILPEQI
jgi:hypothetical protein